MHESSLMQGMLKEIEDVRLKNKGRKVRKITVALATFGNITEEHFRTHFLEATQGTDIENIKLEIQKVPFGLDARLVSVTFF